MPHLLLILLLVLATTSHAATTNTVASVGVPATGNVLIYSDTTGYNTAPGSLTISGTNASLPGVLSANGGAFTNTLTLNGSTVSTASAANPTATIGLSAVNGSAATFLRSDGAPTLPNTGGAYHGAILVPWVDTNGTINLQWKKIPAVWEFTEVISLWTANNANSGSTGNGAAASDTVEQGTYSLTTGTLTNGVAGWRLNLTGCTYTTNTFTLEMRIKTPSALSSDTDGYELYAGFGDAIGDVESADGAYFYYTHSVSNGVWTAKTASNSNRTFASGAASTVTVAIDTWYTVRIEGKSDLVNFWVSTDDGVAWTWVGYSTDNIPNTTARVMGPQISIRKVGPNPGGTTSRTAYIGRAVFWPNRAN